MAFDTSCFDEMIDRRGSHCVKWDGMEPIYGVPRDEGLAMWVWIWVLSRLRSCRTRYRPW